ncbi:MAG TPA: response regulator transcription factor [Candidatus Dormibacteraeota bacterium]|nr:response regulator transcription factor [Candidatus Dormibacteraeota bacterium]
MRSGDRVELLIVDDDPDTRHALATLLGSDGYHVICAPNGREALRLISDQTPDCVILDYAMPEVSGFEVLRTLREAGNDTPVVLLSAKSDSFDKISGYASGADVYVGKDEDPGVLRAAVSRLLQRHGTVSTRIESRGLVIDTATWSCCLDGVPVRLPRRLFTLLHALASQPGRVLRKEQLVYQVWGINSDIYNRAVDNAVVELRRALNEPSGNPRFIHTVRGVGYKFEARP